MSIRKILLIPALAATLLIAACGSDDYESSADNDGATKGGATTSGLPFDSAGANPESSRSVASAPQGEATSGGDDTLPSSSEFDRKIIFTANMSIEASDVSKAFDQASSSARSNGGYLERSSFSNATDEEDRSASLTIRVPVQNYESLLASLRALEGGRVITEGSESAEVTEQYTDLQSRLRNLQSTEQQYLLLLKEAKTIQEILTVQDRLSSVRSQIEQIQGRLKVLDGLTEFATIEVRISPVLAKVEEPKGGLQLTEVWEESWERSVEVARYVAAAAMIAVVALAWLAIPLTALFFIARRLHRAAPPAPPAPPATHEPAA